MANVELDLQFRKSLEVLGKLYINIPFTDTLSQMPFSAKFLKDILANERKLEEHESVALAEEFSVAIQNKLSAKLMDHGSSSIPFLLGNCLLDVLFMIWGQV